MLTKILAMLTEFTIVKSVNTTCYGFSYQPKAPKNIKKFKK